MPSAVFESPGLSLFCFVSFTPGLFHLVSRSTSRKPSILRLPSSFSSIAIPHLCVQLASTRFGMGYTTERLASALSVFRGSEWCRARGHKSENREQYSSSESHPVKRRTMKRGKNTKKRKGCFGNSRGHLTLHLGSNAAKAKLRELAALHGTGYALPVGVGVNPEQKVIKERPFLSTEVSLTPVEQLARQREFETEFADSEAGRSLRSRVVPRRHRACWPCSQEKSREILDNIAPSLCEHLEKHKVKQGKCKEQVEPRSTNCAEIANSSAPSPLRHAQTPAAPVPITTRIVSTMWTHPITFQYKAEASEPCHFCNDFRYGMLGCGRARIKEVKQGPQITYEELPTGNMAKGCEPTRMCAMCAVDRLHISKCPDHRLVSLASCRHLPKLDRQRWFTELGDRSPTRKRKIHYPCCSFCQSPATCVCCAVENNITVQGLRQEKQEMWGRCKLFTCEACRLAYQQNGMKEIKITHGINARDSRCRADLGFLFSGSQLHKTWGVE